MSSQNPPQGRPSKIMSSRLMGMKFMQRAAASNPSLSESHVCSSVTPTSKPQNAATARSCPATSSDQERIRVTLAEEEEQRDSTIERLAKEAGETDWVLSIVREVEEETGRGGLRVAKAGYADIDQEAWRPAMVGRRSFGRFNQDLEKRQNRGTDDCLPSSALNIEASEEQNDEEDNVVTSRGSSHRESRDDAIARANDERQQRIKQHSAEEAELVRLAGERRNNDMGLNRLSSISGTGGSGSKLGSSNKADMECYSCGAKGHAKRSCPQKGKRRNEDWHAGAAKRSKHH